MKNLTVVLVGTKYPRNIGLVSRVLSNFAIDHLILIGLRCELDWEAQKGAAQGQEPLQNATVYDSWTEFFANESDGPRIAFSRRQGRRRASQPLGDVLDLDILQTDRPIYLIFGAEDHGLSSDDLELAHRLAYFELPGEIQSMNLSHSVLMAVHSFYLKFGLSNADVSNEAQQIIDPEPFLRKWLEALNFDLNSQTRWNALTMLKQLVLKATPTAGELHSLEMIVQQTVRRLKTSEKNQDSPR